MNRDCAEQLMSIYAEVSAKLNEASNFVHSLPESERAPHLQVLGGAMADLWLRLQLPIVHANIRNLIRTATNTNDISRNEHPNFGRRRPTAAFQHVEIVFTD